MGEYINRVNTLRDTIKELGKKEPRPVKDNVVRINKDIKGYTVFADEIVKMFGQPSYPALTKFCQVLKTTPDKLRDEFKEFWNENMKEGGGIIRVQVLQNFIKSQKKKYKKNWGVALAAFQKEIEKITYETIDKDNIKDILFHSLGLPRQVKRSQCLRYMIGMKKKLWDMLQGKNVFLMKDAAGLTFTDAEYDKLPSDFDVPDILFCWTIIEDIAARIADSGIKEVTVFSKRGIGGYTDGDYTYYRFNLTVHGSEKSIRKLMKNFYSAYNDRRVYIIQEMSLKRDVDMVAQILGSTGDLIYTTKPRTLTDSMEPGMEDGNPDRSSGVKTAEVLAREKQDAETLKQQAAAELKLPFYKRKSYGETIIGSDLACEAVIAIDYVVYNGFKIKQDESQ
jgi:hypothetical protein